MTDGIIQKVFNKHLDKNYYPNRTKLYILEQELIEEIKKEFPPSKYDGFKMNMTIESMLNMLIGDNV